MPGSGTLYQLLMFIIIWLICYLLRIYELWLGHPSCFLFSWAVFEFKKMFLFYLQCPRWLQSMTKWWSEKFVESQQKVRLFSARFVVLHGEKDKQSKWFWKEPVAYNLTFWSVCSDLLRLPDTWPKLSYDYPHPFFGSNYPYTTFENFDWTFKPHKWTSPIFGEEYVCEKWRCYELFLA